MSTGDYGEFVGRFSEPRMRYYLVAASGDEELALQLYGWNIRIGGALFEDIAVVEVLVRNAFDMALKHEYEGDGEVEGPPWWEQIDLRPDQEALVESATRTAIDETGQDPPWRDSVVARLSLGF
jgi:hypothetical protein